MEKGKFKVDNANKTVTFGHVTKTMDGEVELTTVFDFSKVNADRLLYDAGTARLIKWRVGSGVKKLTTAEALAKFQNATIDCSIVAERVKHIETPEEKELRETLKALLSGQGGAKLSIADLLKRIKEIQPTSEEPTDDEYSAGEVTE